MQDMDFRGRWVLVTGASSGLGLEMARQLAQRHGANLVLVARRAAALEALAAELRAAAGVECVVIAADLSRPEDVERVYAESTTGRDIYAVVLNAGITHFGSHLELDWPGFQQLLATNVTAVVRLATLFAPCLVDKGQGGGLLFVSSMAGFLPVPYQAAYAGSKAFVSNFALSLQQELNEKKVTLTLFAPGGIRTAMTHDSALRYFEDTSLLQSVEDCAAEALGALKARRPLHVPGMMNRLQLFFTRFAPRTLVGAVARTAYRKALTAEGKAW